MITCIACGKSKDDKAFAGEYSIKGKPLCDECREFDNEYVDVCAKCGAVALAEDYEITPVTVYEVEDGEPVDVDSQTKYCDECFDEAKAYAEDWGVYALDELNS